MCQSLQLKRVKPKKFKLRIKKALFLLLKPLLLQYFGKNGTKLQRKCLKKLILNRKN